MPLLYWFLILSIGLYRSYSALHRCLWLQAPWWHYACSAVQIYIINQQHYSDWILYCMQENQWFFLETAWLSWLHWIHSKHLLRVTWTSFQNITFSDKVFQVLNLAAPGTHNRNHMILLNFHAFWWSPIVCWALLEQYLLQVRRKQFTIDDLISCNRINLIWIDHSHMLWNRLIRRSIRTLLIWLQMFLRFIDWLSIS